MNSYMRPLQLDLLFSLSVWEMSYHCTGSGLAGLHLGSLVCLAGHWELDTATVEFLEPGSKRAEPADGPEPVYAQR